MDNWEGAKQLWECEQSGKGGTCVFLGRMAEGTLVPYIESTYSTAHIFIVMLFCVPSGASFICGALNLVLNVENAGLSVGLAFATASLRLSPHS